MAALSGFGAFAAYMADDSGSITTQTHYNGNTWSRMTFGVVGFTMFDGESTSFNFPHMNENELAELIAAIDPILPGRRVE